jgi:hypothetical protein
MTAVLDCNHANQERGAAGPTHWKMIEALLHDRLQMGKQVYQVQGDSRSVPEDGLP